MGQKIFLRMWCRVNFYCTERVIYHVNTMKKKELIFYMMHEMRIVWYLQLGICLFFSLSPVFFFFKEKKSWMVQRLNGSNISPVCVFAKQTKLLLSHVSQFVWSLTQKNVILSKKKKITLFGSILLSLLRCIKKTKQTQASPHVDSNFSVIFFQSHNFVDAVNRWHISGGAVCDCTGLDKFKLRPCSRFTL